MCKKKYGVHSCSNVLKENITLQIFYLYSVINTNYKSPADSTPGTEEWNIRIVLMNKEILNH
jgi:hypothetical protein